MTMKQHNAPPIRCLPLILISMCVTTVVLTYYGSHPQGNPLILAITNDEHPGAYALNKYGKMIPPYTILDILSVENLQELLKGYFESRQVACKELLPIGVTETGTCNYICKELAEKSIVVNNCIVYIFGKTNEALERSIIAKYGCDVFSFDSRLQDKIDPTLKVKRIPMVLGDTVSSYNGVNLVSLDAVRKTLQHEQRYLSLVAIDNDLDEGWRLLEDLVKNDKLKGVTNLFIDLYIYCPDEKCPTSETKVEFLKRIESLRKLYELGFRIYHSMRFSNDDSFTMETQDRIWYRLFLHNINPSYPAFII